MLGAILGVAAATLGGALISSGGASKAASTAAAATDRAAEVQREMFYTSREDLAPWREAGKRALSALEGRIEAGPGEFVPEEEPGFKFGYREFVEKPLMRRASARGGVDSGRTLKELTRYAEDYASTRYDNFLNRWYKSLTPYQSLAGVGQTSAAQMGENALVAGGNIGNALITGGQARASGYANQANIWGGTAAGIGQNLLDYAILKKAGILN